MFSPGVPLRHDVEGLAPIVIVIVKKENDLAPDLRLQPSCGDDFCIKKALRKEPARLLAEADDWMRHLLCGGWLNKDGALQNDAENQHCDATDQIVPKIADAECPKKH